MITQSKKYALYKFVRSNYGPNSHDFDLLLFDKFRLEMHVLTSQENMLKHFIEFKSFTIENDSILITGSKFRSDKSTRVNFNRVYHQWKLVSETESNFTYPKHKVDTFQYFEDYECLGQIADSTYVFVDNDQYGTISPATVFTHFDNRKVYIYNYLTEELKTYPVPSIDNVGLKKVYEKVMVRNDSVRVVGLFADTTHLGATISGAYTANIYAKHVSTARLKELNKGNLIDKDLQTNLTWMQYHYTVNSTQIDLYELRNEKHLVMGCTKDSALWTRLLNNVSTRGPYPHFMKMADGIIALNYGYKKGILPMTKRHNGEPIQAQLHHIKPDGTITHLHGKPIANKREVFLYTSSLTPLGPGQFGIFYFDRKTDRMCLQVFSYKVK